MKTDSIAAPGYAGVWLRVDGSSEQAFDNMAGRGLSGASTWREAIAQVDVPADAQKLVFGPLLVGAGTAWFDDLRLEISGRSAEQTDFGRGISSIQLGIRPRARRSR